MNYEEYEVIRLTQQLVNIDSCNPGQFEGAAGEFVYQWLAATGAEMHRDEVFPGRYNIIARIPGEIDDPNFVYICHLDTVPLGEGWHWDPLKAEIAEGKMYGRGACDMKSGLAAGMVAFKAIAEQKKKPRYSFLFIASVDEEDLMVGAEKAIANGWLRNTSYVLDAEPTRGYILVAHKGKTWFKITAKGLAAHASTPELGIDAVSAMGEFVSALNRRIAACPPHEELGVCSATYGLIDGGVNTNVVPGECHMTIDMRLVPPVTNADSIRMVEESVAEAKAKVKGAEFEVVITAQRPALERDDTSPLLCALKEAVGEVQGRPADVSFFPGYTDSAVVAAMTGCHHCMSYGPGDLGNAHKPDEYVECADILRCADVLTLLAKRMLY